MRVLVFGATGYIGKHITSHLVALGHEVTAFIRRQSDAPSLETTGAKTFIGNLDDPGVLTDVVLEHDAVIWAAQLMLEDEHRVVSAFLDMLEGTNKTFLFTGGTSMLSVRTNGDWDENTYSEDDSFVPRRQIAPRLEIENMVRAAANRNVRGICIRPPLVWGNGGSRVISDLYYSAKQSGAVCYVGRGLNVYSNVHVDDLADVYAKAMEKGVAGALYHAVCGEASYRIMAETIARHLQVPTRSITVSEAAELWDRFSGPIVYSSCSRTRCPRARQELGWHPSPERLNILDDCIHPAYALEGERSPPAWVRQPNK